MSDRLLLIFMLMLVTRGVIAVTHGQAELATPRHGGLGDNSFQNNRSDHQVEIAAQRSSLLNSTAAVSLGNIETGETRRRHSVEDSSSSNAVRFAVAMKALELENKQLKFTLKELQATTEKFATKWQESNFAISQITAVNQQQQLAIGQLQLQVSQLSTNTMKLQDENEALHTQVRSLQEKADSYHEQTQSQLFKVSNLTSGLQAENSSIYTQLQALTAEVIAGKTREETDRLDLLEKVGKLQTQSRYLESNMSKRSSALEERLTSQVIQLQQKDQELMQTIINRTHVDKVGFHARLISSIDAMTTGTLVLDSVQFNFGGGYNSATGIFTAPVTGVYLFLVNMAAYYTGNSARIKIFLGQIELCKTWSRYSTEIEMASCHAATSLIKGNQVRVVMDGSSSFKIRGDFWTTFTGVLIKS